MEISRRKLFGMFLGALVAPKVMKAAEDDILPSAGRPLLAIRDGGYFFVNEANPLASRSYRADEIEQMFRDFDRSYGRQLPFEQWLRTGFTVG